MIALYTNYVKHYMQNNQKFFSIYL